jgi:hypothetical protein
MPNTSPAKRVRRRKDLRTELHLSQEDSRGKITAIGCEHNAISSVWVAPFEGELI